MVARLVSSFGFLFSGLAALLIAVYVASFWLKPAKSQNQVVNQASPAGAQTSTNRPAESVSATGNGDEAIGSEDRPGAEVTTGPTAQSTAQDIDEGTALLEPYLYDTREGRRNPFKPSPLIAPGEYSNQLMGPSTPLERFELDELQLTGILWDVKKPRAMFRDPNGEMHTVTKDDRIGRRRGYVAVIREGEVVVVETATYGGENVFSTRVLRMNR